eukprot:TRINITY_DN4296_c0_g1_i4.p1 TRINITY_DN4296_c0_g1~~TRINITY_DN4296_c0_g1_i4.p1  ORF type:complete len:249 (+),score=-0.23 TRINITY_DN4296_c0_g1_i4:271-1017(+)
MPEWSISQILMLVTFICVMYLSVYKETLRSIPLKKSQTVRTIPSALGLALVYAPAPLLYLFDYFYISTNPYKYSLYHIGLMVAFIGHFLRREFEIFYYKYSGIMDVLDVPTITVGYSTFAALTAYHHNHIDTTLSLPPQYIFGFLIFLAGEIMSSYHYCLITFNPIVDKTKLDIPRGGLFEWIACPHHLGEIICWFGYAIMSRYLIVWVGAVAMTVYLVARASETLAWFQDKFKEQWPPGRKALIPFW